MDMEVIYAINGFTQGAMWMFFMYSFIAGTMATIWWFIPR